MKIFITGINGFIGSHLARHLHGKGMEIYGSSRGSEPRDNLASLVSGYHQLFLNRPFDPTVFAGMDAVVHLAHAQGVKEAETINVQGTRKWYAAAKDAGAKTQLFLTTYSARPGASTEYGRIKYELESFFLQENQPVVRPGLVLGRGGLFDRMARAVQSFPLIPLIDGGRHPVPIVSITALCQALESIIKKPAPALFNISQEKMVPMRTLLQEVKKRLSARCLFVPIPSFLPLLVLKTAEALHIPLPFKSGSIKALKEFRELTYPSSLNQLGIQEKSPAQIVADLFP